MKYLVFGKILLGLALLSGAFLQAEEVYDMELVDQFGTSDSDHGTSITTDGNGNLYITGTTNGVLGVSSSGGYDAFIAKYDNDGGQVWLKQFGTSDSDGVYSIVIDGNGNLYVTGTTNGVLGESNSGDYDAFIAKYDNDGGQVWLKQFGTSDTDRGHSIAIDGNGNLYVTGATNGVLGESNSGGYDAFIAKYDNDGGQVWLKQFGTSDYDEGNSITTDVSGNLYVVGAFPGELNNGYYDVFITKYDSNGGQVWLKQFGTSGSDAGVSIAIDVSGNLYVTGATTGEFPGATNSNDSYDVFIAKYDNDGKQVWVDQFGTPDYDRGDSITIDGSGNLYVTGVTKSILSGEINNGHLDVFVAKYGSDGSKIWVDQFGTLDYDEGNSITTDVSGNLYVVGKTAGTLPDGSNSGSYDAFIVKYIAPVTESLELINEAIDTINEMDPEIFSNPNMGNALTNKLNSILDLINAGEYQEALDKLEKDILPKTDGCTLEPLGVSDKKDWIEDCTEQEVIYNYVNELIDRLNSLINS